MKKVYLFLLFLLVYGGQSFAQSCICLSGPNTLCNNGTPGTFSVSGSAASYTWSVSSNLQIISGQGTSSIQVIPSTPYTPGSATVTVQLGDASCGISLSYPTTLPPPPNAYYYLQPESSPFCTNDRNRMTIEPQGTNLAGIDYFEWGYIDVSSSGPATIVNPYGSVTQDFVFDHAGTYEIYARQGSYCSGLGSTVTYIISVDDNCSGSRGLGGFAAYPNPAGNQLTITSTDKTISTSGATNSTLTASKKKAFSYKIYDEMGKLVKSGKSTGEKTTVDTHDLPSKIYFLNIITEDGTITKKSIIVQHK